MIIYLLMLFFLIRPLIEARAEIQKCFRFFFGSNEDIQSHSEIIWPLDKISFVLAHCLDLDLNDQKMGRFFWQGFSYLKTNKWKLRWDIEKNPASGNGGLHFYHFKTWSLQQGCAKCLPILQKLFYSIPCGYDINT